MAASSPIAIIARNGLGLGTELDVSGDEDPRTPRHALREISAHHPQKQPSRISPEREPQQDTFGPSPSPRPRQRQSPDCWCSGTPTDNRSPRTENSPTGNHLEASLAARQLRLRRQAINYETFRPLDIVQEEDSCMSEAPGANNTPVSPPPAIQDENIKGPCQLKEIPVPTDYLTQIERHLKGKFEWLVTYPAIPSNLSSGECVACDEQIGRGPKRSIYGCNILGQKGPSEHSPAGTGEHPDPSSAERYILLATQLDEDQVSFEGMEPKVVDDDGFSAWQHSPIRSPGPLKVSGIVKAVESALLSPTLSFLSNRSCSAGNRSSSTGSFSLSRIEDSLEELDRLEDELEALADVATSRRMYTRDEKAVWQEAEAAWRMGTPRSTKRASGILASPTPRSRSPPMKTSPSSRRTSTLAEHRRHHSASLNQVGQDPRYRTSRADSNEMAGARTKQHMPTSRPGAEGTREVRARHSREQKAPPPSRTAGSRQPAKANANFELPGEAISRQKRERHEAKLRAEEEERRRRREVKATPIRRGPAASHVPRDTIASRARQAKIQEEFAEKKAAEANKAKRMVHGSPPRSKPSEQARGRSGWASGSASRATSASTVGSRVKRNSAIYALDNPVERQDRERREREMMAKSARETAAERSRMASREWAEQKRRKEATLKRQ